MEVLLRALHARGEDVEVPIRATGTRHIIPLNRAAVRGLFDTTTTDGGMGAGRFEHRVARFERAIELAGTRPDLFEGARAGRLRTPPVMPPERPRTGATTYRHRTARVLLDEVSPYFVAPVTYALAGIARVLPELLDSYRTGAGVPFTAYGDEIRDHIEQLNRPMFVNDLASSWLPAVPELHARLQADPPARVADIACGAGWASISLAQAYPKVRVDGFDLDEASIQRATRNAAEAGVDDRVSFAARDAADPALTGGYHAALVFEALHDLARPVEVLTAARALLADGGCVIVGDERAAETFTLPGDEVERLLYGFSILHCLPASRTETPSAATGTVLRPATLRAYATAAGFREVQVLPVENDMWRFYRLAARDPWSLEL